MRQKNQNKGNAVKYIKHIHHIFIQPFECKNDRESARIC